MSCDYTCPQTFQNPATPGSGSYDNPATPSPVVPESPHSSGGSHYGGSQYGTRTPMYTSDYMTPSPGVSPLTPSSDYSPQTPGSPMENCEWWCKIPASAVLCTGTGEACLGILGNTLSIWLQDPIKDLPDQLFVFYKVLVHCLSSRPAVDELLPSDIEVVIRDSYHVSSEGDVWSQKC